MAKPLTRLPYWPILLIGIVLLVLTSANPLAGAYVFLGTVAGCLVIRWQNKKRLHRNADQ